MKIINKHLTLPNISVASNFLYWISTFEEENGTTARRNESEWKIFRGGRCGRRIGNLFLCLQHKSIMPIHYSHWSFSVFMKNHVSKLKDLLFPFVLLIEAYWTRIDFRSVKWARRKRPISKFMASNFLIIKPERRLNTFCSAGCREWIKKYAQVNSRCRKSWF